MDQGASMTAALYGSASQSWMTLSLLKRPDNSLLIITTTMLDLGLISRTTVAIHMLRLSGPGSSRELPRSLSFQRKYRELPLTTIQRGTNTPAGMSLKAET